jgi:hypothetical protein
MQSQITLLTEMIRSEDSFFRAAFRGLATPAHISQYMTMRSEFYSLMREVVSTAEEETGQFHIHIPAGWGDSVPIQATPEQINRVMTAIPAERELTSCAICQEQNVSREHSVELPCHHQFHIICIREWFRQSARCPVCRNDIRESGMEES